MDKANNEFEEIKKHIRVLQDKIDKFLDKGKPSDILIIKSHLICEYYINQILILKEICNAKELFELKFSEKVTKALDNSKEKQKIIGSKINALNKLRNKVGHELEYVLSEADIDNLGYRDGKEYILDKYEHSNLEDLLRSVLKKIVIDLGLFLFDLVYEEKKNQLN